VLILPRHQARRSSPLVQALSARPDGGVRVQQGQIIGYVGSTGRSTGPHLHYEILVNNRQVNPVTVRLPTGTRLDEGYLPAFLKQVDIVDAEVLSRGSTQFAQNDLMSTLDDAP
jgi:hypothetical protein